MPKARLREFWRARLEGLDVAGAAARVGVSVTCARTWERESGGMIPDLDEPSGRYLSLAEREEISRGIAAEESNAAIARRLGRDPSTIGREIKRNVVGKDRRGQRPAERARADAAQAAGRQGPPRMYRRLDPRASDRAAYRAGVAQAKAEARARRPKPSKLARCPELAEQVRQGLGRRRSPEQVAARLPVDFPDDPEMRVSHETIYQELYVQGRGTLRRELAAALRTGRARRRPRKLASSTGSGNRRLPDEVMISARPPEVADRAVPGHWEGDLIIGKDHASAIATLVERSTRFVMLLHLPGGRWDAATLRDAMVPAITALPEALRRSLTWDQGTEMARWPEIRTAARIDIYFCDPHSPWQRGSNENTNGLLRQYFPKGSDLSVHNPEKLAAVAAELNDRPRKTLNWATPAETLARLLCDPTNTGVATTP